MSTAASLALLTPVLAVPGLILYRNGFRRSGRAGAWGLSGVLIAFLMPHLVLGYSMPFFRSPEIARHFAGYTLMLLGGATCLFACARFQSVGQVFGMDPGKLVTTGIYRFTRNPQYVSYVAFLAGYALLGTSLLVCVAMAMFLCLIHVIVLIEEEHLERHFRDDYLTFKKRVPRYLLL